MSRVSRLLVAAVLCQSLLGCATTEPALPLYAAEVEVYLEPYDERGFCRLHIALRNTSGARQGFSDFRISWQAVGARLPELQLRHNAMRPGMLRSASENLALKCRQIESMHIDSATWELFEGWDNESPARVRIDGADATDWTFEFNKRLGVWAGSRKTG